MFKKHCKKALLIAIIMTAFLGSCSNRLSDTIIPPIETNNTWTISITSNPSGIISSQTFQGNTSDSFTLPLLKTDGYSLYRYVDENGNVYTPGTVLSYNGDRNVTISAEFIKATALPEEGTENKTISEIIEEASGSPVAIQLPSGDYTETETIELKENQSVVIEGLPETATTASLMQRAANEVSNVSINGRFVLSAGSSLILRNVELSSSEVGAHLISSKSGGVTIELYNSVLTTPSEGRAINIATESALNENVSLTVRNSTIYMTGENARGINIDGSPAFSRDKESMLDSAEIIIDNSCLLEKEDSSTTDGYVYAVNVFRTEQADLSVINNSVIQIDSKYYYAIRYYAVGNEYTASTITIDDSTIKAWTAYYIQAGSNNVTGKISNSYISGVNQSDGESDSFTTVGIDSSSNCIVSVEDSTVAFTQLGKAEQQAAAIYYWDNTGLSGGNSISFEDCAFEFEVPDDQLPIVTAYYDNFITCEGSPITPRTPNIITIDNSTLNSLTSKGYSFSSIMGKYCIDPNFNDKEAIEYDEDGYLKIPYDSCYLYNPDLGDGRSIDNKSYQNEQTTITLSI